MVYIVQPCVMDILTLDVNLYTFLVLRGPQSQDHLLLLLRNVLVLLQSNICKEVVPIVSGG